MKRQTDVVSVQQPLEDWERVFVNSIGNVIEVWGFKWNHGRVWALLYLRGVPMTALELQRTLRLSKAAASMITRELEQWETIHRERTGSDASSRFVAETDFMGMVGKVIRERESKLAERILEDLATAKEIGLKSGKLSAEAHARLVKMERAAGMLKASMGLFLKTSMLDFSRVASVFRGGKR